MKIMLTKADITLLVENFPTRAEFEVQIEQLKRDLREEFASKEDFRKVMGLVESVYTEVKKMREEQSAHFNEHRRINDELETHDKRIKRLERPTSVSHRIKK